DWRNGGQDQEDVQGLYDAIVAATKVTDKPSLIALSTIIGWPSPTKQNTGGIHGSALGADEVAATKEILGFDPEKSFQIEPEIMDHVREVAQRGKAERAEWEKSFEQWRSAHPDKAALY
ncbi:transketolase, partial [Mycobacterium tuberculosis]|nr:transketolase [Mycobacterium tuberculosis]